MEPSPVCLTVGGSDSCGGAGIQADLRVFESLHIKGCSAITALTAQNPENILHVQPSSLEQFEAELSAVSTYYNLSCIKTGMLFDAAHVQALMKYIGDTPLVVDPVLIASSGKHLFEQGSAKATYETLIPRATIWTPNLQEASFFLEANIKDPVEAASSLLLKYKIPVLLKGGHGSKTILRDVFCDLDGTIEIFEHPKQTISNEQAHGTGCRLASAIAAYLSLGNDLPTAVHKAHLWLQTELKSC